MFKMPDYKRGFVQANKVIVPATVEKPILASLQPTVPIARKMIGGAAGVRKIMFM
jgi:hypothetical protein